jgi:putative oxidoreductase
MIFILAGWGKLTHLAKVTEYFSSLGLPFPSYQAPFVAFSEFSFGLFLILGIMTELSCIPLTIVMIVALATAKQWAGVSEFLALEEVLLIVILLVIMGNGPGKFSLDALGRKTQRGGFLRQNFLHI